MYKIEITVANGDDCEVYEYFLKTNDSMGIKDGFLTILDKDNVIRSYNTDTILSFTVSEEE